MLTLGLSSANPRCVVTKEKLYRELVVVDSRVFIRAHGRVVGGVLKYENTELYVSIGNNIGLEDAVAIVKQLLVEGKNHLYHYK
ncbi:MAG: endonuclease V [Desulfurococcaceae archaeon]